MTNKRCIHYSIFNCDCNIFLLSRHFMCRQKYLKFKTNGKRKRTKKLQKKIKKKKWARPSMRPVNIVDIKFKFLRKWQQQKFLHHNDDFHIVINLHNTLSMRYIRAQHYVTMTTRVPCSMIRNAALL